MLLIRSTEGLGSITRFLRQPARLEHTTKWKSYFSAEPKCINCGLCADVCPVERPSGFQMGLTLRKAISKSAPRAVPDSYYLLE
ncbi:MAG: 4Fe-4S binding protein, partial [Chloroflexi bacterium]|nr:4Fe-4S binding protein [Chloroflexota bacterium]